MVILLPSRSLRRIDQEDGMNSRLTSAATLALALSSFDAYGQAWPARSPRAIVPVPAGTITDVVPRLIFEQLSAQLGHSIVIENRPGAGTTIAAGLVAKADPDGYTMLINTSAHTIAPALYPNLGYDPTTDLSAVALLGITPSVLVVSRASGFKTIADFVAAAKARPGALNFASAGVGTATHLSAMRFLSSAGVQAVHVPFRGGLEAMKEIIAGRLDFFFAPVGNALPHVQDGALLALVVNGAKRSDALPDVPTTAEAGFIDAEYPFWIGLFLPAKTPQPIVDKLHGEVVKALETPGVRSRLARLGVDAVTMSPGEMDAFIRKQITADAALAKAAGVAPQ
jgi:tripartite-type tricarboxylate transporter receptor subunit TctC